MQEFDEAWKPVAERLRDALKVLGVSFPQCLPGEAEYREEACGGFGQHACAFLGALKAVAEHRIGHLPEGGAEIADGVYASQLEIFRNEDDHTHEPARQRRINNGVWW